MWFSTKLNSFHKAIKRLSYGVTNNSYFREFNATRHFCTDYEGAEVIHKLHTKRLLRECGM